MVSPSLERLERVGRAETFHFHDTAKSLRSGFDPAGGLLRLPVLNSRKNLFRGTAGLDLEEEVPVPGGPGEDPKDPDLGAVSYTHLRAHETRHDLVCRLLLEKKKTK